MMPWWAWALIVWFAVSVPVAIVVGKVIKG